MPIPTGRHEFARGRGVLPPPIALAGLRLLAPDRAGAYLDNRRIPGEGAPALRGFLKREARIAPGREWITVSG